jgi:glycosyltransferase involved in cell wall biosynthesis
LHVAYVIDHLISGGSQRQVVELALALREEPDVRASILVYHEADFFRDRLEDAAIPIACIPKRTMLDASLPLRMRRWIAAQHVDVVHAFLLGPVAWSLLAVLLTGRDGRPAFVAAERNTRIATSPVEAALQRFAYRRSDAVTVNAAEAGESIHRKLGVARERIHCIPNGIDLAAWDRQAGSPPELDLDPAFFHLALIGRLEPQKDHALLLRALDRIGRDRIASWRVWFIGAESGGRGFAEGIRAEVRRRGLGEVVRIVPPVREISAVMSRLDGLVLPSLWEGFPNVLLEAMASRVPAVATRVGEVPRMIADGETGFLVEPGDTEALAAALMRLHALAPAERAAMAARARAVVESRYQIAAIAHAHRDLYAALVRPAVEGTRFGETRV